LIISNGSALVITANEPVAEVARLREKAAASHLLGCGAEWPPGRRAGVEGKEMTALFRNVQIAVVLGIVTSVFSGLLLSVHAQDADPGSITREQWREHVRETKRRICAFR
jgi:hypothetical protein